MSPVLIARLNFLTQRRKGGRGRGLRRVLPHGPAAHDYKIGTARSLTGRRLFCRGCILRVCGAARFWRCRCRLLSSMIWSRSRAAFSYSRLAAAISISCCNSRRISVTLKSPPAFAHDGFLHFAPLQDRVQAFLHGALHAGGGDAVLRVVFHLRCAAVFGDRHQCFHAAASRCRRRDTTSPFTCRAARPAVWMSEVCERR